MAFLSVPFRFQNIPSPASWATCSALHLVWVTHVCLFVFHLKTSCHLALCTAAVTWRFTFVKYLVAHGSRTFLFSSDFFFYLFIDFLWKINGC